MKVKESEKAVLKLNIEKTKIMESSLIDGDTMETVTDFILGGSKITVAAAVAAKLLQSCPTLCNPRDGSLPGSFVPGILQARIQEWVAISFSKITADEIKRRLLLGTKAMTKLDSIVKSRDITLPTKVCLIKVQFFSVVICGCERWTIKKAEHRRTDAFELWCWRRLLRVPWTERRSNQSILKEISPEYSLEGLAKAPVLWPPDAKG